MVGRGWDRGRRVLYPAGGSGEFRDRELLDRSAARFRDPELWRRAGEARLNTDGSRARLELTRAAEGVAASYRVLAAGIERHSSTAVPVNAGPVGDRRLVEAVYRELLRAGDMQANTARMVWTSEYLEAAQKLQLSLSAAAAAAGE
ncbi:hypothetical protein [Streptomyces sp. NPDC004270]